MLPSAYQPKDVEASTYAFWEENQLFRPESQTNLRSDGGRFSMVIPPPNVTGVLHMGHALDNTIQDILTRWHRMRGDKTLWMPGTDHAGIATQNVVERQLKKEGKTKYDLGREAFIERVWEWASISKNEILGQFRRLGISPDWSRQRFTLDEGLSKAVREAFVQLYEKGLIYQGQRIVNWCPRCVSAISDIETEYQDEEGRLWKIAYPLEDGSGQLVVATTRPETMFGDVAVAVHPEDNRYKQFIGKNVRLPLANRLIPVIADDYVEREFGTGALKITPAHDPNDFEIGQRHNLEPIWALDDEGRLKQEDFIPKEIQGLDRAKARELTTQLLEEQGNLVGTEEHQHRVGHCQRCQTTIEPYLSKQWFVSTKPLAEKCIASLDRGEIRFIPERWTKDYLRWLNNIQDWCISRQLWWGHSIPAWYCEDCDSAPIVRREDPTECPHCNSKNLRRDPDVLDTWFSSGLWPFSTMGWPDTNAPDFKEYYLNPNNPNAKYGTDVLVTGFDIIFFWVARMTMFGEELTGRSPFHTVYIHGLIRDEKGQKMSKSKGNTVDPVTTIEEYGCDGFRFGLTNLISYGGQDIKLSKEKLEQGKLFANKLWNASRFVLMNLLPGEDGAPPEIAPSIDKTKLSEMDRWILSRYHSTIADANRQLEEYRFGELAQTLLEFTWHSFCDWYVEYAKKQLRDPETAANTRRILTDVLDGILRLIHPIMPFISETIWQKLPGQTGLSISIAPYPISDSQWIDETHAQAVDYVLATVRAIRNVRQLYTVPHSAQVQVWIEAPEKSEFDALTMGQGIIAHFIKLTDLQIVPKMEKTLTQVGTNVVGQSKILIPLEGLIDVDQELQRLKKKLEDLQKEWNQLNGMMSNADFVAKAPEAVVEKNRNRLTELNQQLKVIQEQLTSLAK